MRDCYPAEVVAVSRITPCMIRVEVSGGDLARFNTSGWPDEWVRLIFPSENGSVTMPRLVDGRWQMPEDLPRSSMRPYTVRHWSKQDAHLIIDFVAHEGGVASDWALNAKIGDPIGVTSPHGKYQPPEGTRWIILIADVTGLPAVGRILEEMPAGVKAIVHLEVPAREDIQDLSATADMNWHFGFGGAEITRLPDIARGVAIPEGPGYIWVAGEARAVATIRDYFTRERNIMKDAMTAIGYWTHGKTRD